MTEVVSSPPPAFIKEKRVSFGDNPVRTFVYEKESEEPTPILQKHPFTDPDAPVSRVLVTSDTVRAESPSAIHPPSQIEEARRFAVSPPLPALQRRMENEGENPFRPEEILYHEVDPIVEAYLHKPFPPSQPGSTHGTPAKQHNGHGSPSYQQNGLSKEDLILSEKAAVQASEPLIQKQEKRKSPVKKSASGGDESLIPEANKAEIVHIKKKKCGCCSVQ